MFGQDFRDFLKEGIEAVVAMLLIMGFLAALVAAFGWLLVKVSAP